MILIDTSVWVDFLRRKGSEAVKDRVSALLSSREACSTCPVSFELELGARSHAELRAIETVLGVCPFIPLERRHWAVASGLGRSLRASGAVVPHGDLLVAAVALAEPCAVLTLDRHFIQIRQKAAPKLEVELLEGGK